MEQNKEFMISLLRKEIEDLQNQQQELVSQFNLKNNEIESAVADYNAKITKLQRDGRELVDKLDNEREQLRGSYQTFKKLIADKQAQLDSYLGARVEAISLEGKSEDKKVEKPKRQKNSKSGHKEEDNGLTPEQILEVEKLSNKSEAVNDSIQNNQSKQSDIPEYLQDEYKKLK